MRVYLSAFDYLGLLHQGLLMSAMEKTALMRVKIICISPIGQLPFVLSIIVFN